MLPIPIKYAHSIDPRTFSLIPSFSVVQSNLKIEPPAVPERSPHRSPAGNQQKMMMQPNSPGSEDEDGELYDAECLNLINEYFYGVRIFPGQDPGHVYVGWVTTQYHCHTRSFNVSKIRRCTISGINDYDSEVER